MIKLTPGEPVWYNDKLIGHYRHDKVFYTVKTAKHFFKKYRGFGINEELLIRLREDGCTKILLIYKGIKKSAVHESTVQQWLNGIPYKNGKEYQRILTEKQLQECEE